MEGKEESSSIYIIIYIYMLRPDSQPDPLRSGQPASKPADRLQSRLTGLQPLVAPQPALKPVKYSVSAYRPAS